MKGVRVKQGSTMRIGRKIQLLEKELALQQSVHLQLLHRNTELQERQQALFNAVTTQGDNLHYIALAAFAAGVEEGSLQDVESLMLDVKVYDMLQKIGSASPQEESYTTRMLRAAITPERVHQIRNASLSDLASLLQSITMRMAMLLQAAPESSEYYSTSLAEVVDQYAQVALLLHVAADRQNLEICTINLDTLKHEEPPAGLWQRLIERLELQPQQRQQLSAAYEVYSARSKPLVAELHDLVQQIHQVITPAASDTWPIMTATLKPAESEALKSNLAALGLLGSSGNSDSDCYKLNKGAASSCDATPTNGGSTSSSFDHLLRCADMHAMDDSRTFEGSLLCFEAVERLGVLLCDFQARINRVRELHRTVTFAWINTLTHRQNAVNIVTCFPFLTPVLTVCQIIHENEKKQAAGLRNNSKVDFLGGAPGS